MNIINHFKIKSQFIKYFLIALFFIVIAISISGDSVMWHVLKYVLVLIPLMLTIDIISEVYEKKIEGFIFVSKTPLYRHFINRFFINILFSAAIIAVLFFISSLGENESFYSYPVLILSSMYISLIGVTISNITKKSIVGFVTAIAFVGMFSMSSDFNESHIIISPLINGVYVTKDFYVINILSLIILSILLFYFNIFMLGKGEKIRGKSSMISFVIIVIIAGFSSNIVDKNIITKSAFSNNSNIELNDKNIGINTSNVNIEGDDWKLAEYKNTKFIYKYISSKEKEVEISKVWHTVYNQLISLTDNTKIDPLMQLQMVSPIQYDKLPYKDKFKVETLRVRFNPSRENGKNWSEYITDEALKKMLLKNITDPNIVNGFSTYLKNNFIMPSMYENLGNKYWKENLDKKNFYNPIKSKKNYLDTVSKVLNKEKFDSTWDAEFVSAGILNKCYETDKTKFKKLLNHIYLSNNKLNTEDVEKIIKKYYGNIFNDLFRKYELAKKSSVSNDVDKKAIPEEP